ncbi:MAG: vWA domain-containing protein [Candidatus Hodarchaeales archaeon]
MSSRRLLQSRGFIWEALQEHKRAVALILAVTVTLPLFAFTSLPPIEVLEEVPEEIEQTIQIPVNQTVEVEVNITEEVVLNRTIGVNITEGGSVFLEPQPPPKMIDADIVVCIDLSGSMDTGSPLTRMNITQIALHNLLNVLNRSVSNNLTDDRVALVTYYGSQDSDWYNDANIDVGLDFVSNITHLSTLRNKTDSLTPYTTPANYYTDIWAGLNYSLDVLLKNPRNTPTMKLVLLLTDGAHNTGPWGIDMGGGDYSGFLKLQPNQSANYGDPVEFGPNSANPLNQSRDNDIKIFSIGMLTSPFEEEFLQQISENPENGTGGRYFDGDDIFNLTEAFIRARDEASGWSSVLMNDTAITNNGSLEYFTFNVTEDVKRLKWDINWNSSEVKFNLTIVDPSGTLIHPHNNTFENIKFLVDQQPYTANIDFPEQGIWGFRISWENITSSELLKGRLSSFEPPIFIESITQFNSTDFNQSVLFMVNVTNKNPIFTYNNITPHILSNFTAYNITNTWSPPLVANLTLNSSTSFTLNLTFNEPVLLQGTIYFKVNSSEGFYDAVAQDVSLDYRITTENVTIESYIENRTITVLENQTITTISLGITKTIGYTYNRQVFDTLKWGGFFASFGLLMSFLAVYVTAQAYRLRKLAETVRVRLSRLFPDQAALEIALQSEGISVAPEELSAVIEETDGLDQFGENIFNLTGKKLTPEDLIRLTSGVSSDQIITRLSFVTGRSPDEIADLLKDASSVEALIEQLHLDEDRFLDIITRDEQVLSFQSKVSSLILPKRRVTSNIVLKEDFDISRFRSQLRRKVD